MVNRATRQRRTLNWWRQIDRRYFLDKRMDIRRKIKTVCHRSLFGPFWRAGLESCYRSGTTRQRRDKRMWQNISACCGGVSNVIKDGSDKLNRYYSGVGRQQDIRDG